MQALFGGRGTFFAYIDLAVLIIFDYFIIHNYGWNIIDPFNHGLQFGGLFVVHFGMIVYCPIEGLILYLIDKRQDVMDKQQNLRSDNQ